MTVRGDQIGDAVSDALNSPPLDVLTGTLDERKHRIWRAICNALEPYFEQHWVDFYDDPTVNAHYITGSTPYPMQTIAWQLTESTEVPVAVWLKSGADALEWSLLWPQDGTGGGGGGGAGLVVAYEQDFTQWDDFTFTADDDYTLEDGKEWRFQNYANAGVCEVVNGEGIHIAINANASSDATNQNTTPRLGTYIGNLTDVITMAPDVYSQLDLWIWVRASWVSAMTPSTYDRIIVGFCYAATKVGPYNYGLAWRIRQWSGFNNNATFEQHEQHNTPPNTISSDGYASWFAHDSPVHDVFVFHVRPGYHVDNYYGTSLPNGLFPPKQDLTFAGSTIIPLSGTILAGGIVSTALYPHIYFSAGGNSASAEIVVQRLKVEYLSFSISTGGPEHEGFTDVTISGGDIAGFTSHRTLRVTGAGPLVGIQDTGFVDGELLALAVVADLEVTCMGGTGLVPIKGPWDQGTYLPSFTVPAGEEITLRFYANSGAPFFKYRGGSTV
jgi:hypothetical protein